MNISQHASFDSSKYKPFPVFDMLQREWPGKRIEKAPRWCSEDLRDGNQALINPLSVEQKSVFFKLLVNIGFKEIVVGFPSASQADFDFVRLLIEQQMIPDDVTISVLTPAREAFIQRSFEALKGAKQAIVHLYNSTSKIQREKVFNLDDQAVIRLAVNAAQIMQDCADKQSETSWTFEYTPESFTATEPEFALEICNAVGKVWQPTVEHPVIFNLPSTVENTTPNIYADRIEWFSKHIDNREGIILSVHTHNDRGCAIASAELAILAGAQRVEGTLLGNGERTGNADLLVMAMNLYSQGIDPELDFSEMSTIVETVSRLNQIDLHPRHPYAGELVFSAFSGSHQDAIKKCLTAYQTGDQWDVAYLPIDPVDIGRNYQEVVRINSQSGKGGVAYVIEQALGLQLPRWLQSEFSLIVQHKAEQTGCEILPAELEALYKANYLEGDDCYRLLSFNIQHEQQDILQAQLSTPDGDIKITGAGDGALAAFINALQTHFGREIEIVHYDEHALSTGTDAKAICYIQLEINGRLQTGIASHSDIVSASLNAVLSSLSIK
ncbi:MAG: 2-isopropylmalate synthase [Methylococcaceae bacterium]|nr:2-isopropylmalate synthase [Methylococcaceae bacterium]